MLKKKICVIGLGYIGLPTAALLASKGFTVNGVDIDEKIVNSVNNGKPHINEFGLKETLKLAIESKKLTASITPNPSDIFIICVPTPVHKKENFFSPNLDYVISAIYSLINVIKENNYLIIESTIPVGTTKKIENILLEKGIKKNKVSIAHCPERVLPGNIIHELVYNDRVIGGVNKKSATLIKKFYETFVIGNIYVTDTKTAEMCKLTENSYRDVNIAFANELSMICEKEKIDTLELIELTNKHPRVNILEPGPGVGGHCIPVDPWFIISQNREISKLLKISREVNSKKTFWVIDKIIDKADKFFKKKGKKPIIAIIGITFKPNVDDMRESPSIDIVNKLKKYYNIISYDPNVQNYKDLTLVKDLNDLKVADIGVILVKHKKFISTKLKIIFENKILLDFCGFFKMKKYN